MKRPLAVIGILVLGPYLAQAFAPCIHPVTRSPRKDTLRFIAGSKCIHQNRLTAMRFSPNTEMVATTLDDFFSTQPFLAAFMACGMKASAADFLAQTSNTKDESETWSTGHPVDAVKEGSWTTERIFSDVNLPRNLAFLLYGGLYQGAFLQLLYLDVYPAFFGDSFFRIPLCIFSDICIFGPFVTLPLAYLLRAIIEDDTIHDTASSYVSNLVNVMEEGIAKYKHHIVSENLLYKYWVIWAPAQTLNNCFVPAHLRVFFVALVSFFWVYLLSILSSEDPERTTVPRITSTPSSG